MKRFPLLFIFIALLLCAATYAYISSGAPGNIKGSLAMSMPGGGQAMPLMLETIKEEPYRRWQEFPGRLKAVDSVNIHPRVGGAIVEVLFEEGSLVNADDKLFIIDPRPYEAALASANAALASARSQAELAKTELNRAKQLIKKKFLSKSVYDQRESNYKVALAAIKSAQAAVKSAKLDLEYAHIKAPISGRVGRAELTVGNLVSGGANAPILTTIVAHNKMYAEFEVDEQTYLHIARYKQHKGANMPVQLKLKGDHKTLYDGMLHSFDNQLDIGSGTIRARSIFNNDDGVLVPGMFATIRLGDSAEENTIRISERAIGVDQNRRFVYVIDEENKAVYREVTLGSMSDGKRVVLSGLKPGERIVPSGIQRVRPGMLVQPIEGQPQAMPQG